MKSKEEKVLSLFYNNPKHWHFEELVSEVNISRRQLSLWLKKFQRLELILRIKKKGKMPYYIVDQNNVKFRNLKNTFAFNQLSQSGLFEHIQSLKSVKVSIIFGSFARGDWCKESDLDIFIYGDDSDFEQGKFEKILQRNIQLFSVKDKKGIKKMNKMLPYVLSGDFIKGSVSEMGVTINAEI